MSTRSTERRDPNRESQRVRDRNAQLLLDIENQWMAGRIRGETDMTEHLLTDDYLGGNSRGAPHTKADFVAAMKSARRPFVDYVQTDRSIRICGQTGVSTGTVTLTSPQGQVSFRYLRVFQKRKGEWRLIASQSATVTAKEHS